MQAVSISGNPPLVSYYVNTLLPGLDTVSVSQCTAYSAVYNCSETIGMRGASSARAGSMMIYFPFL